MAELLRRLAKLAPGAAPAAGAALGLGGVGLSAYNSLFNVEGGHRAIVFNRVFGVKDKVRAAKRGGGDRKGRGIKGGNGWGNGGRGVGAARLHSLCCGELSTKATKAAPRAPARARTPGGGGWGACVPCGGVRGAPAARVCPCAAARPASFCGGWRWRLLQWGAGAPRGDLAPSGAHARCRGVVGDLIPSRGAPPDGVGRGGARARPRPRCLLTRRHARPPASGLIALRCLRPAAGCRTLAPRRRGAPP